MISILLCGKPNEYDDNITNILLNALSKNGGVQYYNGHILKSSCDNPEFLIYESETIPQTENINGIAIFKNSFCNKKPVYKMDNFTSIVYDQNKEATLALKNTKGFAISCGMSSPNTLSIASIDDDNAVVSLQRGIKTFDGKMIEPHDFLVRFNNPTPVFPILGSSAVLLLKNIDSSNGYNI